MKSAPVLCFVESLGLGGGVEQLLVELIPLLQQKGVHCEVVALFDWIPDLGVNLEQLGFKIHRWRLGNLASRVDLLRGIPKLMSLLLTRKFSLFWGHGFSGNLYAALGQLLTFNMRPACVTIHSPGHKLASFWRPTILAEKLLIGRARAKVAVSQSVREDYLSLYKNSEISVIYNGSPVAKKPVNGSAVRESYGIRENDFFVLVPSRFTENKGQRVLIEALAIMSRKFGFRPKVLNPGVGPTRKSLECLADQLAVRDQICFTDSMLHADLITVASAVDLVVIPSIREPFGIAAIEAMLLESCVLVSRVDGLAEIAGPLAEEWIPTVPPGDPDALADRIWLFSQNASLRREWGARGSLRAHNLFSLESCADSWARKLKGIVEF